MKNLKLTKRQAVQLAVFCKMVPMKEMATVGEFEAISQLGEELKQAAKSYYDKDVEFGKESSETAEKIKELEAAKKPFEKELAKFSKIKEEFGKFAATVGVEEIAIEAQEDTLKSVAKLFNTYGTKTSFPQEDVLKLNAALK